MNESTRTLLMDDHDLDGYIFDLTCQIPKGMVSTYGALAKALGDIAASRAIGQVLSSNPRPIEVPCHRVIYSDGRVGWYCGAGKGNETKVGLLREEGVKIGDRGTVDLKDSLFTDFKIRPILAELSEAQRAASKDVDENLSGNGATRIVAMDVSYQGRMAYGAGIMVEASTGEVLKEVGIGHEVGFPYVPTYLGFREFPVMRRLLPLLGDVDGAIFLCDGHGRMHPRGFGVACHFGLLLDLPTIGVAKSHLVGSVQRNGLVLKEGMPIGRTLGQGNAPLFISVGHRIGLDRAYDIVSDGRTARNALRSAHISANALRKAEV